jgi:hypothetical protein
VRLYVINGLRGLINTRNEQCEIVLREHVDHVTLDAGVIPTRLTADQMFELAGQLQHMAQIIRREQKKTNRAPEPPPPPAKKPRKKRAPKEPAAKSSPQTHDVAR